MGLDMYAYASEHCREDWKGGEDEPFPQEEIMYWRKVRQVHNFMEDLYISRGGRKVFNLIPIELKLEDLDNLEQKLRNKELREDGGFFFGDWDMDKDAIEDTLTFIREARKRINLGQHIYYDSWW